jgi:glyoxylase-like metal-dependent hydrolase (beta-lactamase superfamily II)
MSMACPYPDPVPTADLATVRWIHGAPDCDHSADPPIQVVRLDDDTFVLRQSMCLDFEAPFLYLLIGADAALLHDTGATAEPELFPIRHTVDRILAGRPNLLGRPRPLIVTHSHGHDDHRAGDRQFADLGRDARAPIGADAVATYFRISDWPTGRTMIDFGDRPIDILATPGHLGDHIMLFDRTRGLLLSGDSLYPGLLTVRDWSAYRASIRRVSAFARESAASGHPVRHILGAHIEMTDRPGELYEIGTTYQPDEHPLPLSVRDLFSLDAALDDAGDDPRTIPGDRFVVQPADDE